MTFDHNVPKEWESFDTVPHKALLGSWFMSRKSTKDISINTNTKIAKTCSRLPGGHAYMSILHLALFKLVIIGDQNDNKERKPPHYLILRTALYLWPSKHIILHIIHPPKQFTPRVSKDQGPWLSLPKFLNRTRVSKKNCTTYIHTDLHNVTNCRLLGFFQPQRIKKNKEPPNVQEDFWAKSGRHPSVSKSNHLHVDIFQV
jgi:hypothetical protein